MAGRLLAMYVPDSGSSHTVPYILLTLDQEGPMSTETEIHPEHH